MIKEKRDTRLHTASAFNKVLSGGRPFVHPLLVLYAVPNGLDYSRAGLSVSRRVGNAVVRNRVRRRLAALWRLYGQEAPLGWDIVLVGRRAAAEVDFSQLVQAWREGLRQLEGRGQ